jgi:hypothetical protein
MSNRGEELAIGIAGIPMVDLPRRYGVKDSKFLSKLFRFESK